MFYKIKKSIPICVITMTLSSFAYTQEVAEARPFSLDDVIHPRLGALIDPKDRPNIIGLEMPVSGKSEQVSGHVKQGFALVHAQWDFEAYRHFAAALKEDDECLMAYCGVAFALAKPFNEYTSCRVAAVDRILDLIEADDLLEKSGEPEKFPRFEKMFAIATANLVAVSPVGAGRQFKELGRGFPNMLQSKLIGAFMTRGSYDINGYPDTQQEQTIQSIKALIKETPENPMVHSFLLSLLAQAPDNHKDFDLKTEVLPYARFLVKKHPDMPSWRYTLGHYEWRAGNYSLAEAAFTKSSEQYSEWMLKNDISINDSEGYIKSMCYLANTLYQRGNFDRAIEIAKELREIKLDAARPHSAGNEILLWRGYTLMSRLYAARGNEGDLDKALEHLPNKKDLKSFVEIENTPSLVGAYIEAFATYLGARRAVEAGDHKAAEFLHKDSFRKIETKIKEFAVPAQRSGQFDHYFNAGSSLAILDMELAGLIALNGPEDSQLTASNWFRSARDKQGVPSAMLPPLVIEPMENRLAEYYKKVKDDVASYEAYRSGLERYPNNMASLLGVKETLARLKKEDLLKRVEAHIESVKP